MNYMNLIKRWGLPILVITAAFTLLPAWLSDVLGPSVGPTFGEYFGYFISAIVAAVSLWVVRFTDKRIK